MIQDCKKMRNVTSSFDILISLNTGYINDSWNGERNNLKGTKWCLEISCYQNLSNSNEDLLCEHSRQVEEVTVNKGYVIQSFQDRSPGIFWLLLSPPAFPVIEPMSALLTAWPLWSLWLQNDFPVYLGTQKPSVSIFWLKTRFVSLYLSKIDHCGNLHSRVSNVS